MERDEKFWAKVVPQPDGCHYWRGSVYKNGYGELRRDKRKLYAHRYSYEQTHGPIPPGMVVCHSCDVRICVNPEHLWLGTQADNVRDMHAKGRNVPTHFGAGERAGHNKLTWAEVREIRERFTRGEDKKILGPAYGVTPENIWHIVTGRTWKESA